MPYLDGATSHRPGMNATRRTSRRAHRSTGLRPVPGGGVKWFVPGRRSAVAETTTATSDLIVGLVYAGASSFRMVAEAVHFDNDAIELCAVMARHGAIDARLEVDGHHVRFAE